MYSRRQKRTVGQPPGTPIFTGIQKEEEVYMEVIRYNKSEFQRLETEDIDELLEGIETTEYQSWINITGLHDVGVVRNLGDKLNIDPLILEDIVNTSQRPKIEDMGDYFLVVFKELHFNKEEEEIRPEHMSFIVSKNYIISFQERRGDNFDVIRERLRKDLGMIRKSGIDYLFNRLLDAIVDNYFLVIHELGELVEDLEDIVVTDPSQETLETIQNLKQETNVVRRLVLPLREVVGIIIKLDSIVVTPKTLVFSRSIYDHLVQVIDSIEVYREMLTGFLDIYLSSLSNKTNDVMKILTIITSIFIPLSFLAGVYGMNFENMPELEYKYGYYILLGIMMTISGGMILFFRSKKWLW